MLIKVSIVELAVLWPTRRDPVVAAGTDVSRPSNVQVGRMRLGLDKVHRNTALNATRLHVIDVTRLS
jgi:hypothetical protein